MGSASEPRSLTTKFDDTLRFYLNGTRVVLDDIDPEITLLEYLRGIGLTGTKLWVAPLSPSSQLAISLPSHNILDNP